MRGSPPGYSTSRPRFTNSFLDTHQDTLRQGLPHWITPPQSRSPLPLGEGPGVRAAPQTPFVLSLSKDSLPRQSRRKTRHRKRRPPPKIATPGPFHHPTPTPYPVSSQAIRKAKRALVSPCLTQHLKLGIWFQVSRPTLSVLQRFRASVAAFHRTGSRSTAGVTIAPCRAITTGSGSPPRCTGHGSLETGPESPGWVEGLRR